jgi:hypothetical protein
MRAMLDTTDVPDPVNDSYAGTLCVEVEVALDTADDPISTMHDLARLMLTIADHPLDYDSDFGEED